MSDLPKRLVTSVIAISLFALFMWLAPLEWFRPFVGIAVAALASVGLWEYYMLAQAKGFAPPIVFCLIAGVFLLLIRFLQSQGMLPSYAAAWAIGLILFILFCDLLAKQSDAIANLSTSIFGLLYVVIPFSLSFDVLYTVQFGREWLIFAIAATVITDAAGYFVGKMIGKHKLSPRLSPNKTIEGAVGGVVCATLTGWAWHAIGFHEAELIHLLIMGFLFGVIGQIGDLAESLLKRDARVKDSNRIPGIGGILDMSDSLLFNIPLLYGFLKGVMG